MDTHHPNDPEPVPGGQQGHPEGRLLSVTEAAVLYNFPLDRLVRRLDAGGVPGAVRRSGEDYEGGAGQWCIPESSLAALGYSPAKDSRAQGEDPATPSPAIDEGRRSETTALGQLAGDLRRRTAAELAEVVAERDALLAERDALLDERDAERQKLTRDREELEAAFEALEEYRTALESDMAKLEVVRQRVDQRAKALASDRRKLTAATKKADARAAQLAAEREELAAERQQHEDQWLEIRQRATADPAKASVDRVPRRRRVPPDSPSAEPGGQQWQPPRRRRNPPPPAT